jgi:tungstate transport system ATP-binding protein
VRALSAVDLRVAAGERLALVGANGSGKSTLLRVLHGLVAPSAGTVRRDGATRQAMLFQRPYLLRTSALNNVALGLWIRGTPWKQAREQALTAIARVGLADAAQRNARALSGGQQQRLALARAWALKPDVLFLDEPTSSLDPHAKREVEALMAEFAQGGMTLVFASHNLGQVKRLATRVVYLEHGRVLADLPVDAFFNGPRLRESSREAELFVKGELA